MNDDNQFITQPEATALAHFIHAIRNDWDAAGIIGQLGAARTRAPKADLAIAAIRAASNRTNRTPAIIGYDGAHWRTPEPHEQPTRLPQFPDCAKHPGNKLIGCPECRQTRVAMPTEIRKRYTRDTTNSARTHQQQTARAQPVTKEDA